MTDSHVLLVGATRGLGRAVAWRLAEASRSEVRLSVVARRSPKSDALPPIARTWTVDIVDAPALRHAIDDIVQCQGCPKGIAFFQRRRDPDASDDWERELAVSLGATRTAIEHLVKHHGLADASVVLVSSVNATFISPALPPSYHVAKAGLVSLARYYAAVLGSRGIRVNSVSPGTFLKDESREAFAAEPARVRHHERATALGRIGTAEEVARAVTFLLGPDSTFITGHNLVVDGGASLRYQETLGSPEPNAL